MSTELREHDFAFNGMYGSQNAQIKRVGKNHFKVTLSHAPNHLDWTNELQFQILRNAAGNDLRLDVFFEGGVRYNFNHYFVSYSYDRQNWHPVHWQYRTKEAAVNFDTISFPVFQSDQVFVGHQVPLAYEDILKWIDVWSSDSNIEVHNVGESLLGKNIYRIEMGTKGAENLHYFAGQHPGEHNAQWRMIGMIEWLRSNEAAKFRNNNSCHFVLTMCPDGPANGWYRTNAEGIDMNRSYNAAGANQDVQTKEAYLCQKDLETLVDGAKGLITVWAMHTWSGNVEPLLTLGKKFNDYIGDWTNLKQAIIKHDKENLIKPLKVKESRVGNISWTGGPHEQFAITVCLCEGGGDLYTKEENVNSGKALIQGLAEVCT